MTVSGNYLNLNFEITEGDGSLPDDAKGIIEVESFTIAKQTTATNVTTSVSVETKTSEAESDGTSTFACKINKKGVTTTMLTSISNTTITEKSASSGSTQPACQYEVTYKLKITIDYDYDRMLDSGNKKRTYYYGQTVSGSETYNVWQPICTSYGNVATTFTNTGGKD